MTSNFQFNNGGSVADVSSVAIPRSIFAQGGMWTWGYSSSGALGNNTSATSVSSPVQTIAGGSNWKIHSTSDDSVLSIKSDGTLWGWGRNTFGQLGNNTTTGRSSPIQTISSGTNWKQAAAGAYHSAAVKTDGSLWLWGRNNYGQMGNSTTTNYSSPVQTVAGGSNWEYVSCGNGVTAAIKTDGTLWLWGKNNYGNLGDNTRTSSSSPVQTVASGNNWSLVSVMSYYSAAIKTDGTLWLWGFNNYGQLGDNSIASSSSPVQTVAGGTNWKAVSLGSVHSIALKTDGSLWTWGQNFYGQLGDNTTTYKSSPVQTVAGGLNWKSVSGGGYLSGAIKKDGSLWTWGLNTSGQLADNTTVNKSSPVQTAAGGTSWKAVSMGQQFGSAITDIY